MAQAKPRSPTVDGYIAAFPKDVQAGLGKIRKTILGTLKKIAPQAEEVVSYGIPAYRLEGMLVFFGAYTRHYSLAMPPVTAAFTVYRKELSRYAVSKSTIQFPFGESLPLDLIAGIVKIRAAENLKKAAGKKAKPSAKNGAKNGAKKSVKKSVK